MKKIAHTIKYDNEITIEFLLDRKEIVITNDAADKSMVVIIDQIIRDLDVWKFQIEYLKLSDDAVSFIKRICEEKMLVLI